MDIGLHLETKQVLSQQMILSMQLLQMNTMELEHYLEEYAAGNPVVVLESPEEIPIENGEKLWRMEERVAACDLENAGFYRYDRQDAYGSEGAAWRDPATAGETLEEALRLQIPERIWRQVPGPEGESLETEYSPITEEERNTLLYMIRCLDEKGYFFDGVKETAAHLGVSRKQVLTMLNILQGMEPAGVGARDLRECLLLQWERLAEPIPAAGQIISDYLEDIGKQHFKQVAKALGVTQSEFEEALSQIRSLDPKPGAGFYQSSSPGYITPDALVVKDETGFDVVINEYGVPRIRIDEEYQSLANSTEDREARSYLKEKIRDAGQVSRLLENRSSTMQKIMQVVVERQSAFFREGPGNKRVMRLMDVAEDTGLHESTVSRAFRSKYIQCDWGCFPLSYFLTQAAPSRGMTPGSEDETTEAVQKLLKEIVDAEDKSKPLSDEAISQRLKEAGHPISRRTVNKYRRILGIPDKSGRKKWEE